MKHKPILFLLILSSFLLAQIDEYSYTREIEGIESQWHKIVLPNDFFRNASANLSDIRIYGRKSDGNIIEAPYLLHIARDSIRKTDISFNQINASSNAQGYFYTFELPENTSINQMDLEFENENFDWRVDVEGSQDQQEWFMLAKDYRILAIKNPQTDYRFTSVSFKEAKFRYLRIRIVADQQPELSKAKLTQYRVESGNYRKYAIPGHEVAIDENTNETVIDLTLADRLPVSRLQIDIRDEFDYYRSIQIEYLADSVETEKGWKYSYRNLHSNTLTSFESGKFTFPSTLLRKLRVRIRNQRNQPLTIGAISAEGPEYSLTARFTEEADYVLAYGNSKVLRPQYDIARFKATIPTELKELTLGAEEVNLSDRESDTEPLFANPVWLWSIMIVIVAILGWFSMKMLKNEGES